MMFPLLLVGFETKFVLPLKPEKKAFHHHPPKMLQKQKSYGRSKLKTSIQPPDGKNQKKIDEFFKKTKEQMYHKQTQPMHKMSFKEQRVDEKYQKLSNLFSQSAVVTMNPLYEFNESPSTSNSPIRFNLHKNQKQSTPMDLDETFPNETQIQQKIEIAKRSGNEFVTAADIFETGIGQSQDRKEFIKLISSDQALSQPKINIEDSVARIIGKKPTHLNDEIFDDSDFAAKKTTSNEISSMKEIGKFMTVNEDDFLIESSENQLQSMDIDTKPIQSNVIDSSGVNRFKYVSASQMNNSTHTTHWETAVPTHQNKKIKLETEYKDDIATMVRKARDKLSQQQSRR